MPVLEIENQKKGALPSHCTNSAVAYYNKISKSDSRLEDIFFRSFFLDVMPVRITVQNRFYCQGFITTRILKL
jgi:hypothetical protein